MRCGLINSNGQFLRQSEINMTTSEKNYILEVKKLEVVYNRVALAIQGVSFKVPEKQIVAILGVNGAGKSTTLRAISGFIRSDNAEITDGTVEYKGEILNGKPPQEIARRGLILVPEREKVFATLSVKENLSSSVAAWGKTGEAMELVYDYFPVLKERQHQMAGYLSGGERQMLAIGNGLVCGPKLLMVDEVSLGLAPIIVGHLMETLKRLNEEQGFTMLVVEQNAVAALGIADYGYIMESGRAVFDGPKKDLMEHEDVKEFYLGIGGAATKSYRDVKQYRRVRRWWA